MMRCIVNGTVSVVAYKIITRINTNGKPGKLCTSLNLRGEKFQVKKDGIWWLNVYGREQSYKYGVTITIKAG